MTISFSVEWLFFIIPFSIAWAFSLKYSSVNSGWGWSDRDCYWLLAFPFTLIISLSSWGIYLRWFK